MNELAQRYRLEEEIGRGGMGAVYRAHDTLLGRDVAVKVLSQPGLGTEGRARLLREARAVAALDHPNIVAVYDAGESEGEPFIVMQLVAGHSLREQPTRTLPETVDVARQVCAALAHAHAHGIIHRDLKPANVLVTPDGTVKLMDFGLARSVDSRLTTEGAIVGTVHYLAPEQAQGGELDSRTDLYALGVMLYELAAGRLPFIADDPVAVIMQHLNQAPAPPTTYNPAIPPGLETIILRLLAKDPADRYASAGDVLRALAETEAQPAELARARKPASAKAEERRHNLPPEMTSFIGREHELEAIRGLLLNREVRLLTLTGPGGTGKTRLGLKAAAAVADEFEDGVYSVPLAPISDPALVISAIAENLHIREAAERPLPEMVKDFVREREMLLVLDNFEQVSQAAPLVAELLAAAPRLKLVVTSRVILRVYGERDLSVPPLPLPDLADLPPLERLKRIDGVRLFVERAQAIKSDFALGEDNARAVAEICTRLDGLPLAIELAAARVRMLPPAAIASRLTSRLKFLTGGSLDLPARQQTLRDTVEWSYDLLSPAEQTLFQRAAVFAGGFTLEAAETVCNAGGDLRIDTLDGLGSLIDNSLMRQEAASGEPRFTMLETIREYALDRLAASGQIQAVRRRHAEFFLALAGEAEPNLTSGRRRAWLEKLKSEIDNFRAALQWAREGGDPLLGLKLATALYWYWYFAGHLSEGRGWLRSAVRQVAAAGVDAPLPRARALNAETELAWLEGDFEAGRSLAEEALAIFRAMGDEAGLAEALMNWGMVVRDGGDPQMGRPMLEESLAIRRRLGDPWWLAQVLVGLGRTLALLGEPGAARPLLEEAEASYREIGDDWGRAISLENLGVVATLQGDYAQAEALYRATLELYLRAEDKVFIVRCLEELAWAATRRGNFVRAAVLFGAVEALREKIGALLQEVSRAEHNRYVAEVRRSLAPADYAAAWAEGRAMSLEQAVAYATGE